MTFVTAEKVVFFLYICIYLKFCKVLPCFVFCFIQKVDGIFANILPAPQVIACWGFLLVHCYVAQLFVTFVTFCSATLRDIYKIAFFLYICIYLKFCEVLPFFVFCFIQKVDNIFANVPSSPKVIACWGFLLVCCFVA